MRETKIYTPDGDPFLRITIEHFKDLDGSVDVELTISEWLKNIKTATHTYTLFCNTLTPELELKITNILIELCIKNGGINGHMVMLTFKNLGWEVTGHYVT